MSYVDEIYERVVAQNPGEPEFHQAVKEVLDSLRLVIDANEEKYRKAGILERFTEPERIVSFRVQCNRTVQGRTSFPSICKPGHLKVLRFRADFEELSDWSSYGRWQRRFQL